MYHFRHRYLPISDNQTGTSSLSSLCLAGKQKRTGGAFIQGPANGMGILASVPLGLGILGIPPVELERPEPTPRLRLCRCGWLGLRVGPRVGGLRPASVQRDSRTCGIQMDVSQRPLRERQSALQRTCWYGGRR